MNPSSQSILNDGMSLMQQSIGLSCFESLFDQHYQAFGYPAERLKTLTIKGLLTKLSWPAAIDVLMQAASADPKNADYKHHLALVLEHIGEIHRATNMRRQIAEIRPKWFSNNISLGRLLEHAEPSGTMRAYYAQACETPSAYRLALARSVAINGPKIRSDTSVEQFDRQIESTGLAPADDLLLWLANGFFSLANNDDRGARNNFSAACIISEKMPLSTVNHDEWSLGYARAYMLGVIPPGKTAVPTFAFIDPVKLALACASSERAKGSIFVLSEYGAALVRSLPKVPSLNYRLYHGYRIALHQGTYYAVPRVITEFSFYHGHVINVPARSAGTVPAWKQFLFDHMSPRMRKRLKSSARLGLRIGSLFVRLTPGGRGLVHYIRRKVIGHYIHKHAVNGVLMDRDYRNLRERIDASPHSSVTAEEAA